MASGGDDPLIGRTVAGKYVVEAKLGEGAMGVVYRANQIALDKTVAIKVLHREVAGNASLVERFRREAKAASRLDHPNSIRVFDFGGEPDGLLYLAMEYLDGRNLLAFMTGGSLSPQAIVELLSQVLAALSVAHDLGIFHRDLKPENIMIVRSRGDDGQAVDIVKVCDFGIAKILEPDGPPTPLNGPRRHTTAGIVVGTPDYMSPEQARGQAVDGRSDLYSVGVILYELLTGRLPFQATTPLDVLLKHLSETPASPSSVVPTIDPRLEAVCLKALEKQTADRFQDAREMRQALRDAVAGDSSAPPPRVFGPAPTSSASALRVRADSTPTLEAGVVHRPELPQPRRRRPRAWLLAFALVPIVGAVALGIRLRGQTSPSSSGTEPASVAPPSATATEGTPVMATAMATTREAAPQQQAAVASVPTPPPAGPWPGRPAPHETRVREVEPPLPPIPAAPAPSSQAASDPLPVAPPPPPLPLPVPSASAAPAPAPLPSPPVQTPAPRPAFDLSHAHVAIGDATNAIGATGSSVTRTVHEAAAQIDGCYREELPRLTGAIEGRGRLHVETDGAGSITDARITGPVDAGMRACVASALHGRRIPNVDTGSASADIPLEFTPR